MRPVCTTRSKYHTFLFFFWSAWTEITEQPTFPLTSKTVRRSRHAATLYRNSDCFFSFIITKLTLSSWPSSSSSSPSGGSSSSPSSSAGLSANLHQFGGQWKLSTGLVKLWNKHNNNTECLQTFHKRAPEQLECLRTAKFDRNCGEGEEGSLALLHTEDFTDIYTQVRTHYYVHVHTETNTQTCTHTHKHTHMIIDMYTYINTDTHK